MAMTTGEAADRFWRDGYVVLPGFFPLARVAGLNTLILGQFGADTAFWHTEEFLTRARTEVIPWFPQKEGVAAFSDLEDHAPLAELTDRVLGPGWNRLYCMVMYSKQGTAGQAWHQDCPPEDPARFNLNRLVYTHDVTEATGGQTVVLPGSHRRGLLPAGDPDEPFDGQVVLSPRAGTLVLLHGHTYHKVLPVSGPYRASTNYRATPAGTPEDITDICVYRNMRYSFASNRVVEERSA